MNEITCQALKMITSQKQIRIHAEKTCVYLHVRLEPATIWRMSECVSKE